MSRTLLNIRTVLIVGAFVILGLAAVAIAAEPDDDGTIHACFDRNGPYGTDGPPGIPDGPDGGVANNLYVIDPATESCAGLSQAAGTTLDEITFGGRGAQGAQGAPGARGATGAQGPVGPTGPTERSYVKTGRRPAFKTEKQFKAPKFFSLPPGGWDITASVALTGTANQEVRCKLLFGATKSSYDKRSQFLYGDAGEATVELHWTGQFLTRRVVKVVCAAGTRAAAPNIRVMAVPYR